MASGSFPAASSVVAGSTASSSSSSSGVAGGLRRPPARVVTFRLAHRPKLSLFSSKLCGVLGNRRASSVLVKSQRAEVPDDREKPVGVKPDVPKGDVAGAPATDATTNKVSVEAVSEFMNQVASLVKLVDSRDIVELQLKQQDYELVIRKEAALPQPPPSTPFVIAQPQGTPVLSPQYLPPPPTAPAAPSPAAAGARQAPPPPASTPPMSAKSSVPPLKSPMAGTFYRSPGPGQPPFVKVGDKVNKGQVLCIIEAMKLMNEIEADQAGTVAEILVDDGKPVSIDQPLFTIEP